MFKTSQEIRLNTTGGGPNQYSKRNDGGNVCGFGKYFRTPDMGKWFEKGGDKCKGNN